MIIPASYRKALGIKPGGEVFLILNNGEIKICSKSHTIKRVQTLVRRYVPEGRSLSDELIQERREKATHA